MARIATYRPSGKFGVGAIPTGLAVGIVGGVAIGWAYQALIDWVSFIYINLVATGGFGFLAGVAAGLGLKIGKNRNASVAVVVGLVCALASVAATHHFAYLSYTERSLEHARGEATRDPERVVERVLLQHITVEDIRAALSYADYLKERAGSGWEARSINIKGIFVWLIWLIELGVVAVLSVVICTTGTKSPYCEACGKWTDSVELGSMDYVDAAGIRKAVQHGDLEALLQPAPLEGAKGRVDAKYGVEACGGCDVRFLSVTLEWEGKDDKGKPETKTDAIMEHAVVSPAQVAALAERL